MSRPWRGPRTHDPREIIEALGKGKTLKDLALTERSFPYASRLALLMTESGSDKFFMSRETIRRRTNPLDDAEMDAAFRTIERRWQLFRYDAKNRRHRRRYQSVKESPEEFKVRVLGLIDAELAILWKIGEITKNGPGPAPHSNADFAADIGRDERTVRRCVASLAEDGFFAVVRGGHNGRARSLYFRPSPDVDYVVTSIEERRERYRRRADPSAPDHGVVSQRASGITGCLSSAAGGTFIAF